MFSRVINTNDPLQFYHNLAQNWTGGSNYNKSTFNVYNTNELSPVSLNQFSINLFQNWAECAKKKFTLISKQIFGTVCRRNIHR